MGEYIFDSKGYELRFLCSGVLPAEKNESGKTISYRAVRIEYLGAASLQEGGPCREDRFAVRALKSPWTGSIDPNAAAGIFADPSGGLWTGYWSQILLKDPAIRTSGLLFRYTVAKETAVFKPHLRLFAEGMTLYDTDLDTAGTFEVVLDPEKAAEPVRSYLERSHRTGRLLLKEMLQICEKHAIPYYLFCGTLLGAVRHGGFVPWDDDLDVAMPRKAFEQFLICAQEEWKDRKELLLLRPGELGGDVFLDYMTRVVWMDEETGSNLFDGIEKKGRTDLKGKAALDVYVLEQASRIKILHMLQTGLIRGIYGLCLGHRAEDKGSYPGKSKRDQRAAIFLKKAGRRMPLPLLLRAYEWVCSWFRNGTGPDYFQANGYILCIPRKSRKDWFGSGKKMLFGGIQAAVPEDYDSFLRQQYGEYRELPHVFHRIPSHMRRDDKI